MHGIVKRREGGRRGISVGKMFSVNFCFSEENFMFICGKFICMLENVLKWSTDSDANLTVVCRHRWSRKTKMNVDKY